MKRVLVVLIAFWTQLVLAKMVVGEKPPPQKVPPMALGKELLEIGRKKLAEVQAKKYLDIKSYHYCKAVAWLQFASELLESNPHDGAANQAVHEALRMAEQLEKGKVEELLTGIFSDYKILRVGLWDSAQHFQKDPKKPCGPCFQAQLEIQLVAAGHQAKKSGDDAVQELIEEAEELEKQMHNPTRACVTREELFASVSETAPPIASSPPKGESPDGPARQHLKTIKEKFDSNKFFFYATGASTRNIVNVLAYGAFKKKLSEDVAFRKVVQNGQLKSVRLTGHTDVQKTIDMQGKLSQERAESLKKDLAPLLPEILIETRGLGSERPLRDCKPEDKSCNLYNNRVEVEFVFE